MVFAPCLFGCQARGSMSAVIQNVRKEQEFILRLLEHLDVALLEDEDAWIPVHGRSRSISSSECSSSTEETSSNTISTVSVVENAEPCRPSLESVSSHSSTTFSYSSSLASSRGTRSPQLRTQAGKAKGCERVCNVSEAPQSEPTSITTTDIDASKPSILDSEDDKVEHQQQFAPTSAFVQPLILVQEVD